MKAKLYLSKAFKRFCLVMDNEEDSKFDACFPISAIGQVKIQKYISEHKIEITNKKEFVFLK